MLLMLRDRVAIRTISDPDKIGHIWVPDTAKRKSDQGVIIYIGDDVKELKVGDHVLFPAYSGTQVAVAEEGHYLIMPEEEIVAVLGEGERVFTQKEVESYLDRAWQQAVTEDVKTYIDAFMDLLTGAEIRAMEN